MTYNIGFVTLSYTSIHILPAIPQGFPNRVRPSMDIGSVLDLVAKGLTSVLLQGDLVHRQPWWQWYGLYPVYLFYVCFKLAAHV